MTLEENVKTITRVAYLELRATDSDPLRRLIEGESINESPINSNTCNCERLASYSEYSVSQRANSFDSKLLIEMSETPVDPSCSTRMNRNLLFSCDPASNQDDDFCGSTENYH